MCPWLLPRTVNTCFTIFELLGDVLVSWLPLYYEAKIVFVVFMTIPNFRVRLRSPLLHPTPVESLLTIGMIVYMCFLRLPRLCTRVKVI